MMAKDFIKDLFGFNDEEFAKLTENFSKIIETAMKDCEKCDDNGSYCASLNERYDDGKLVKRDEKEYINGKCVKNNTFDASKCLDKKDCNKKDDCIECGKLNADIRELKAKINTLKEQIHEMSQYIDTANDKIKKLTIEKSNLQSTIDNIKGCF